MIKTLRRSWRIFQRLMAPITAHRGATATVAFSAGVALSAMATNRYLMLSLGILTGICLSMVTMVAVWEFQDRKTPVRRKVI